MNRVSRSCLLDVQHIFLRLRIMFVYSCRIGEFRPSKHNTDGFWDPAVAWQLKKDILNAGNGDDYWESIKSVLSTNQIKLDIRHLPRHWKYRNSQWKMFLQWESEGAWLVYYSAYISSNLKRRQCSQKISRKEYVIVISIEISRLATCKFWKVIAAETSTTP